MEKVARTVMFPCKYANNGCHSVEMRYRVIIPCYNFSGNIRNLAMEKVASTVSFPCKYANNGCQTTHLHTEKQEHEETCEHR